MARAKSAEKRRALLDAAVLVIAERGTGAATAEMARRAGVATGTLFTYFATKEELLNELYFELKAEVYAEVNKAFPQGAPAKRRAEHVWRSSLRWAIESPERRKVSVQLHVSDVLTAETRARVAEARVAVEETLGELERRASMRGLPKGFAAATMAAMQEATMDFVAKQPRARERLIALGFEVFWRAVR